MKIEEGKYYLDRDYNTRGPMRPFGEMVYRWASGVHTYTDYGGYLQTGAHERDLIQECTKDGEPIMNDLKDLEAKYEELGKEIERLKKKPEPLMMRDLRRGQCFRFAWEKTTGAIRRMYVDDYGYAHCDTGTLVIAPIVAGDAPVVLQDQYGIDLPPEKQVKP